MKKFKITDFDAVAFDVEGTIADTIPTHHTTRMQAFSKHGFGHITKEQHELGPTYGSSHFDVLGGILQAAGEIDNSVPFHQNQKVLAVIETKAALFKTAAARGFDAMPGATKFIKAIAPYFVDKMALVTSSEEEFVLPFIKRYKLGKYFPEERVIGHETVTAEGLEVKPSADPFLLAKRKMQAKRMLVFEDTVPGVASAKKAGATVIALGFDRQNVLLFESGKLEYPPDLIVDSYREAARLLGVQK